MPRLRPTCCAKCSHEAVGTGSGPAVGAVLIQTLMTTLDAAW